MIDGRIGIEVKGSRRVSPADLKGLHALADETVLTKRLVVAMEPRERTTDDGIVILPAVQFFEDLWAGRVIAESPP